MLACARVETREVDDMHYDASEEESILEMEIETGAIHLEKARPILNAPQTQTQTQQRSVSESTWKTWPGKHALRPRPVISGYSTSDDEELGVGGNATRGHVRKTRVVKRRASWPQPPLTPKAHDSGVQGLDDSDTDSGSADGEVRMRRTRQKREPDVLASRQIDGESGEESVLFKGITDADSSEERWRQIVLEEHMDKIFNAVPVPKLPDKDDMQEVVWDELVARGTFTSDDWGGRPRKFNWKEELLMVLRFLGCGRKKKIQETGGMGNEARRLFANKRRYAM
jgi:hypothetical protein